MNQEGYAWTHMKQTTFSCELLDGKDYDDEGCVCVDGGVFV